MGLQRLKRSVEVALAASAVAVVAGTLAVPAGAQPSDPVKEYQELGAEAAKAEEDLTEAEMAHDANQAELDRAKESVAQARRIEDGALREQEELRGEIDRLAGSACRGARVDEFTAALTSNGPDEFLERATMLGALADNNAKVLAGYNEALARARSSREQAQESELRAQQATDEAARLLDEVQRRKDDLDERIGEVRQALGELGDSDRERLQGPVDTGAYLGPPGAANTALQAALSKRGSEYEWGSKGPTTFDCSGLTQWAYKQAGISIPPSSRTQWTAGRPVSRSQLQPGDLVFYDDGSGDPSTIHHVAMYVGGGKVVDAPTEGQLVDVRSVEGDGHYIGARRIAG
ncbi:NlpC/P60 family protein [Saccharopolyspora sp. WRP15-2]|uniref:NlpC/P60 family protein n=1 Tax=Saccharopolyspora oryzae TaxID=2997343 RepID=A0ABT4V4V0_9PSEU|nr:C40 family peptidase [Saccharopolyspora oryzae]MDA3628991.1 NlpC/P60 family protein [Saccharopolyspora oryzae]